MKNFQLGKLYNQYSHRGYITEPEIFYCISQRNRESKYVRPYTFEAYTEQGPWGTHFNADEPAYVRLNFYYWTHGKKTLDELANMPVVFDFIYHWETNNHRTGGRYGNPAGFNAVFADGHVTFNKDNFLCSVDDVLLPIQNARFLQQ